MEEGMKRIWEGFLKFVGRNLFVPVIAWTVKRAEARGDEASVQRGTKLLENLKKEAA
jgi:hypothetical protein